MLNFSKRHILIPYNFLKVAESGQTNILFSGNEHTPSSYLWLLTRRLAGTSRISNRIDVPTPNLPQIPRIDNTETTPWNSAQKSSKDNSILLS